MSKLGNAVTGVIVSGAVAAGGFVGNMEKNDKYFGSELRCRTELGNQAVARCLSDAREDYGNGDSLPMAVLEIAGTIGVVLMGGAGYKAVKET